MDEFRRAAKIFYDHEAETYDKQFTSPVWSKISTPLTFIQIKSLLKPGMCILDVGGGTGRWAEKILQTADVTIIVLDISSKMLEKSKIRLSPYQNADLIQGDICSLPFEPQTFDLALAELDVISYCFHPKDAVKEIYRVLKTKGFFHMSVDSLYSMVRTYVASEEIEKAEKICETGVFSFSVDDHILHSHAFTPDTICELLEKTGFNIHDIRGNPVLTHILPLEKRKSILSNDKTCRKLLELEKKLSKCLPLIGNSLHIEVTAHKEV